VSASEGPDNILLIITSGVVPSEWKLANIIPIFKSGDKNNFSNYRPISITSTVSKILEKIICKHLLHHLYQTGQVDKNQHGFLPRRSCSTMHLETINNWQQIPDCNPGGHIHAISLDWEKAFDRIPHSRLLLKLRGAGFNGSLLQWFKCYLYQRKQRVIFGGQFSDEFDVPSGVIHGSVLGPLIFNLFISDLSNAVSSDLVLYADDSTLYRHISSFPDEIALQEDLNNIVVWSLNNGMSLNVKKCKFMDITLSSLRRFGRYTVNGNLLDHSDCIKLLGVYISFDLSWNKHVDYTRNKPAQLLGFVNRNLKIVHPGLFVNHICLYLDQLSCMELLGCNQILLQTFRNFN
jgi:hypothetical protein